MTQATADLDETATDTQPEAEFSADVLSAFADDEHALPATTSLEDGAEASANPDPDDPSRADESTGTAAVEPEVNALTTALQRLATLEANHKKHSDDVHGRVGMLEQVLKAQARTPVGQKVRLTMEDFEDFGKEYTEFAEAQVKAVNKALEKLEMTGLSQEFTAGLIKDAQTAAVAAAEREYIQKRTIECREDLNETHPGWEQIVGLPDKDVEAGGVIPDTEYRRWLATQPKEYAERVLGGFSSIVIGRSIDKFTASKKSQKPQPTTNSGPSTRQQQLRAAVTPRASGAAPSPKKELSGREAMLAEFADTN